MRVPKQRGILAITELPIGKKARITGYLAHSGPKFQKLMTLGLLPGMGVIVRQRTPVYVVEAGYTQVAMDEELAGNITVTLM